MVLSHGARRTVVEPQSAETGLAGSLSGPRQQCLVKWRELPYEDCTWEDVNDVRIPDANAAVGWRVLHYWGVMLRELVATHANIGNRCHGTGDRLPAAPIHVALQE